MSFTSLTFGIFLLVVFAVYWQAGSGSKRIQNALLLIASCVFYGWWDWRFLGLIGLSIAVDYSIGLALGQTQVLRKRKMLLLASLSVNLGLLGFFKYFNFFIDSFRIAFGLSAQGPDALTIILPVGISFYTFQTLSYTIDIYRGRIQPTADWLSFAAFVSFFPQLVAGPIERARHLLPQFEITRKFNDAQARDGLRQMLWGFFKKLVIADNCATLADAAFNDPSQSGSVLLLGIVAFSIQIYGDFSGYSDIAIGTARLFGVSLSQNFATPYFSRDIAEFWRRWHISLSTWFRDYVYIPLGGSKGSKWVTLRNVVIVFVVSGLWHGAAWTFVVWGALHAAYMAPLVLSGSMQRNKKPVEAPTWLPTFSEALQIAATLVLVFFAWTFFRANSVSDAFAILSKICSSSLFTALELQSRSFLALLIIFCLVMFGVEWRFRESLHGLQQVAGINSTWQRWTIYVSLITCIGLFMRSSGSSFIYFQF